MIKTPVFVKPEPPGDFAPEHSRYELWPGYKWLPLCANIQSKDEAERIALCINAHDALVAALEKMLWWTEAYKEDWSYVDADADIKLATEALKLAKGE